MLIQYFLQNFIQLSHIDTIVNKDFFMFEESKGSEECDQPLNCLSLFSQRLHFSPGRT